MQCQDWEAETKEAKGDTSTWITKVPCQSYRGRDPRLQGMANTAQIAVFTGQEKQHYTQMFDMYDINMIIELG